MLQCRRRDQRAKTMVDTISTKKRQMSGADDETNLRSRNVDVRVVRLATPKGHNDWQHSSATQVWNVWMVSFWARARQGTLRRGATVDPRPSCLGRRAARAPYVPQWQAGPLWNSHSSYPFPIYPPGNLHFTNSQATHPIMEDLLVHMGVMWFGWRWYGISSLHEL